MNECNSELYQTPWGLIQFPSNQENTPSAKDAPQEHEYCQNEASEDSDNDALNPPKSRPNKSSALPERLKVKSPCAETHYPDPPHQLDGDPRVIKQYQLRFAEPTKNLLDFLCKHHFLTNRHQWLMNLVENALSTGREDYLRIHRSSSTNTPFSIDP